MDRYDLVVIGAGPAGEKGASQAAYFGHEVAVVERADAPGGTAVGTGGIPTKTLREAALYLSGFRDRDIYGLSLSLDPETAFARIAERTREVTELMYRKVQENLDRHGIELVQGTASLGPEKTVRAVGADGSMRELQADVILIATGSRPFRPPSVPFDDPDVHDSDSILTLERLPGSLAVVGGGPVGVEYASIATALGVETTLIDSSPRLLPFADREMSELLATIFRDEGMRLLLDGGHAEIARVDGRLEVTAGGTTIEPEAVLFAAGRAGNTEGLGLEDVGVELDERGRIVVDDRFRTTADGILAAGDVIGPPALASVSMEQARVAVCHAFGIDFKDTVDPWPPIGVYAVPELAMVGKTEEEATADGIDIETGRGLFSENTRAVIAGHTDGLIKLVFEADTRTLLGVHIVADVAAELIHIGQMVLQEGGTIDRFIHSTFAVPTFSDAYKYAAYDGLQRLAARG